MTALATVLLLGPHNLRKWAPFSPRDRQELTLTRAERHEQDRSQLVWCLTPSRPTKCYKRHQDRNAWEPLLVCV